jgi:hypothetical protein
MSRILHNRATLVWLILVLATGVSWWTGVNERRNIVQDVTFVSALILLIAFVKIRFVLLYFMELRRSPLLLRMLFEAWVVIVFGTLAGLYWFG